jgi:hypothetical protein
MDRLRDFREQAAECRALASKSRNQEYKTQLLELVVRWETLADEREKLLEAQRRLQANA